MPILHCRHTVLQGHKHLGGAELGSRPGMGGNTRWLETRHSQASDLRAESEREKVSVFFCIIMPPDAKEGVGRETVYNYTMDGGEKMHYHKLMTQETDKKTKKKWGGGGGGVVRRKSGALYQCEGEGEQT